jgi:putative NIF3 family GTP cyclohydrolase 1 type 2
MTDLQLVLEQLAPARLARMGDEPHWQGYQRNSVSKLGVCVDSTAENLQLAAELGVDAIVAHHGWDGSLPELVSAKQMAIYKCHTNWDRAAGGNSVVLAEQLGLREIVGFNYSAVGNCAPMAAADLITRAGRLVRRRAVPYLGDALQQVNRVGVMAGACFGPGFEDEWAELLRQGAQMVLSGDMSQRVARSFVSRGVIAVDIGHSSSELPGMERLADLLGERLPIPVVMLQDCYRLQVAMV